MSADVNASEIMQNMVMNDDDKEWYALLFKKMHKDFLKPRYTVNQAKPGKQGLRAEPGMDQGLNCSLDLSLKGCLVSEELVTEPDDLERKRKKKKKKKTDEFNAVGAGNIAGYTLPLGASNQNKKARKKNAGVNARAFGGGKVVGKL